MSILILGLAIFLGTHSVRIFADEWRARQIARLGEIPWKGVYSVVALATLVWMVWAYTKAPLQPLWQAASFRLWPLFVMPFSLILVAAGYMTRNPGAVMQQEALKRPEPARGILRITRHPLMWGIILWAAVHILARGDLASLVFFGGFLLLAALGTILLDLRKAATLGEDWRRFADATSNIPFVAIAARRNRFDLREIGWKRIGVGLVLYVVLLLAHPYLFGARPY